MRAQTQPFAAAMARLHEAMAKVANGDISSIKALYAHGDEATSFYGWGGYEKGWRLEGGEWRLLHRHANRLEDQYQPSTRLKPAG